MDMFCNCIIFADNYWLKSMKLHIFNPEHDIALAYNRPHLTMPHTVQVLRNSLGWIPALWAGENDLVLVADVNSARNASFRFRKRMKNITFVSTSDLKDYDIDAVDPWGWDVTIKTELMESGVREDLLPSNKRLESIRNLSNRRNTSVVLNELCNGEYWMCGESTYIQSVNDLMGLLKEQKNIVAKVPWSSSGRGIRYITDGDMTDSTLGFLSRTIQLQGGIMVEPYYPKVIDFGMEFVAKKDGSIDFVGVSLFKTERAAYAGNVIASEDEKLLYLSQYLSLDNQVEPVINRICQIFPQLMKDVYEGPFGVDMMIVSRPEKNGFLLHPCVEINVRRTMGHVALDLFKNSPSACPYLMYLEHNTSCYFRIRKLQYM